MSFMVFKPTSHGSSNMSNLMQPQTARMSPATTAQTRPTNNQVRLPFAESIHVFDPSWHPPTPQSQARPLHQAHQFPPSPYQHQHVSPRYSSNSNTQQQQAPQTIPAPATLTSPGVTIGVIALTCYDELALIRYCVDFQGYYRSGYRTKFWVAARKALRSVVNKDVEDVEQRMRVLLAKRRVEKGVLDDHGVARKALVMPEYRGLLDKWDDRVRYVESGEEKVASRETGMDEGDSDGVGSPVKGAAEVPNMTTPSSNPGWLIESPTRGQETSEEPSPVQNPSSADKSHRTRLKPAEEVVLLRLCVQHKDLYKTLFKATFWKFIQKKLQDETGKHFTNPDGRIKVLLKRRENERKEMQERGRLTIDLVDRRYKPWLDKWQECVDEVGGHRKRRTRDGTDVRSAEEVLRDSNTSSNTDATLQQPSPQTSDAFHIGTAGTDAYPSRQGKGHGHGHGQWHDADIEMVNVEHDRIMQDLSSDPSANNNLLLRLEGNRVKQMDLFRKRLDSVTDVVGAMSKERDEMKRQIEGLQKDLAS